eukprot:CFRG1563T1
MDDSATKTQGDIPHTACCTDIPDFGWVKKLSEDFEFKNGKKPKPLQPTSVVQIASLMGLAYRFWKYTRAVKKEGRIPFMDPMNPQSLDAYKGVPMGGIGGGTVCRSWKGQFNRWNLSPGLYTYDTVWADQFILRINRPGQDKPYQVVLCVSSPKGQALPSWNWSYKGKGGSYHALYPRAWITYDFPEHKIKLVCRQVSPVIPHDYSASSLPVCVFEWSVVNCGEEEADISIAMTWANGYGTKEDSSGGHENFVFTQSNNSNEENEGSVHGIELQNRYMYNSNDCTPYAFGIAALELPAGRIEVTYDAHFIANGSGKRLWQVLEQNGKFQNRPSTKVSKKGQVIGAAVCCSATVKPKETFEKMAVFSLAWDYPIADFPGSTKTQYRQYTKFHGTDGRACAALCADALSSYSDWERRIHEWQYPILSDSGLPDWYKSALFNESYFIADGGTVWLAGKDEIGRFGYLEGHEYRMFNTYDVHFYASWALTLNWPKLAASVQRDYADAIMWEDPRPWPLMMGGTAIKRATAGACPHDLGDPSDDPWVNINCYNIHDTARWKDLGSKFVLQVYRDYSLSKDISLLEYCWPAMSATMNYLLKYDKDGDGVIENENFADQTYDVWLVDGVSAYCGGLWVGAVMIMTEVCKILSSNGRTLTTITELKKWEEIGTKGAKVYNDKLWNGTYYNYDGSKSAHNDSIQSDQCAAHFYLQASKLNSFCPSSRVQSALKTIYDFNVMSVKNGTMGAMNGMRPDGSIDHTSMQSEEIWTGVTYQVAATMIQEGLVEEGFNTAKGVYNWVWMKSGMAFQTPEGYFADGSYRSLCYMRPLSIWSMQHAWEMRKVAENMTDRNHTDTENVMETTPPSANETAPTDMVNSVSDSPREANGLALSGTEEVKAAD